MKRFLLLAVTVLSITGCARASSPLIIDISTVDGKAICTLNSVSKTPDEIGLWFVDTVKLFGPNVGGVIIRPDNRTTFATVLDIALRLKSAGITNIDIPSGLPDAKKGEWGRLILSTTTISREEAPHPLGPRP